MARSEISLRYDTVMVRIQIYFCKQPEEQL